jgi:hypothetical protein
MEFNTGVRTVSFLFESVFMTHIFFSIVHYFCFPFSSSGYLRCEKMATDRLGTINGRILNGYHCSLLISVNERRRGVGTWCPDGQEIPRKRTKMQQPLSAKNVTRGDGRQFPIRFIRTRSRRPRKKQNKGTTPIWPRETGLPLPDTGKLSSSESSHLGVEEKRIIHFPYLPLVHQPPTRTSTFFLYRPHCFVKWSQGERGKKL